MRHLTMRHYLMDCLLLLTLIISLTLASQTQPTFAQDATQPPTMAATSATVQQSQSAGIDPANLQPITRLNAKRIMPLTRFGRGTLDGIAWSPDGTTLAVATDVGTWMYAANRLDDEPRLWPTASYPMGQIVFSPDGKLMATLGDGGLLFGYRQTAVWVWDVQTGKLAATFGYQDQVIVGIAFSPDSKLLAAGTGNAIQVWNLETKKNVAILYGSEFTADEVAFSPDGKVLVSISSDTIRVWNVSTRRTVRTLQVPQDLIDNLVFSPDGKLLLTSSNTTLYLWDFQSGKLLATYKHDIAEGYVRGIALRPDGKQVAFGVEGEGYGEVWLWDVTTQQISATWKGHRMGVGEVAYSPDGKRLASASYDNTVRVWDVASGRTVSIVNDDSPTVVNVAFSPDSKTLAALHMDLGVRLWDVHQGKNVAILGRNGVVLGGNGDYGLAYSPDGKLLASEGLDNAVTLWDAQTNQNVTTFSGDPANTIAFSPDGNLLATGSNTGLSLWDPANHKVIASLGQSTDAEHITEVNTIAFSPDGNLLASAGVVLYKNLSTPILQIWDVHTHKRVADLNTGAFGLDNIAFSPDGKLLAASSDENTVSFWAVKSGYPLVNVWGYPAHEPGSVAIAFSPDDQLLALSGIDGMIQLRVVKGGEVVAYVPGQGGIVSHMAFSPDGKLIGAGSYDGTITLWGVEGS